MLSPVVAPVVNTTCEPFVAVKSVLGTSREPLRYTSTNPTSYVALKVVWPEVAVYSCRSAVPFTADPASVQADPE